MKRLITNPFTLLLFFYCIQAQSQPYYYTPNISNIFSVHNCGSCHGSSGGLSVSYNGLFTGGSSCGQAIIPFNANGSPLVTKIDPAIPNCSGGKMPPSGNVSAANIAIIKEWINTGALQNSSSSCEDLLISAYMEGTSFNKYLEIYNGTGANVNLSGYAIRIYSNGSATVSSTIPLSGTINNDSYLLIAHTNADLPGLTPDITNALLNFNGNDAVALFNGSFNIDVFGQIGIDPGATGWLGAGCSTTDQTWVKTTLSATCPIGAFSGNTDFTPILSTLYTCFPIDEASVFHNYIECNLPDAPPPPLVTNVCYNESLPMIDFEIPLGGDYTYQIYDVPTGGTPIFNGLSFTVPTSGTFYAALYESSTGCEGERQAFTINVLSSQPTASILDQICSPDNLTYDLQFVISGVSVAALTDVATDLPISLNTDNEGTIVAIPTGEGALIRIVDIDNCIAFVAFEPFTCVEEPVCPTIIYPSGSTSIVTVYHGQEYTLSALVVNPITDVILWSNGQTGNNITLTADNPDFCSVQQFTYSAQVADVPGSCAPAILPFNVTIYPDPFQSAQLVVSPLDSCTVGVTVCNPVGQYSISLSGYSVNGGALQIGDSYTALAGQTSTINFEIVVTDSLNVPSSYSLSANVECPAITDINTPIVTAEPLAINRIADSPNRSEWQLYYNLPDSETGILSLMVYDAMGRLFYKQQFESTIAGEQEQFLQIPSISSGLYLVQLSGVTQKTLYKWVKLN
jgi:hypothetical protein